MRAVSAFTMAGASLFCLACEPAADHAPLAIELNFSQHVATPQNFGTTLTGAEEFPTPINTKARGTAIFQLSADGTELRYRLVVSNVLNVTQAHIHCGHERENGPIVLWLYPPAPPATLIPGRTDGVLGAGVATDADVMDRPSTAICPGGVADLADLVEKLENGLAYANVHTSANPGGEIRGQIEEHGHH